MLTHEEISTAVAKVAKNYPIAKVSYFGSYAEGNATEDSDLDLLIEFNKQIMCYVEISGLKIDLEELLNKTVDLIPTPLSKNSTLEINKMVHVYG
jgi:predicted nucleotidyltransferase